MSLWSKIDSIERRLAAIEEKLVHVDEPRPTLDDVYEEVEGMGNELLGMARRYQREENYPMCNAYDDVARALGKVLDTIGEVRGRLNRNVL